MTKLHLIAAVARDGGIGHANELLVRQPEDLQRFKQLTLGHPVIMGRRTWESLPAAFRPLPGRLNVVVTRQTDYVAKGAAVAHTLSQALTVCSEAPDVYVIGGAQLYAEALPLADQLDLTELDACFQADTWFPELDMSEWREVFREAHQAGPKDDHAFSLVVLDRMR